MVSQMQGRLISDGLARIPLALALARLVERERDKALEVNTRGGVRFRHLPSQSGRDRQPRGLLVIAEISPYPPEPSRQFHHKHARECPMP